MRRAIPTAALAAGLAATLATTLGLSQLPASALATTGTTASSATAAGSVAARDVERTRFALSAVAYGTRVAGGQVPAGSGSTAFQRIGCTNLAGLARRNYEAELTLPGLGVAEGVTTRVWTERRGDTVSSSSVHDIARLTLLETPLGSLQVRGVSARSRAFHDGVRFGTRVTGSVARIVLKPTGAPAQDLAVPTPGQPVVVPGLARIAIGETVRRSDREGARASANVLDITLLPTGTRVRVAQTDARIGRGVRQGVFSGYSAGLTANALDENLRVGRTPLLKMPCAGTGGEVQRRDLAGLDLGGQLVAGGLQTRQVGTNRRLVARGTESGRVARVELAEGRIVIRAVRGVVNVTRTRDGVRSNTKGTTVGSIVVDGETYSLPATGPLEIPGLVTIEDAVTSRIKHGRKVVALRVTLLDGTGGVIDLGVAQLAVKPGAPRR